MRISDRIISAAFMAFMSLTATAQSEGGLVASLEAEKKLGKKLSVEAEAELRTRNDFKTMDRWSIGLGASYKFNKWMLATRSSTRTSTRTSV